MNEINDRNIILDYIWFNYLYNDDYSMNDDFNEDKESYIFMFFIK